MFDLVLQEATCCLDVLCLTAHSEKQTMTFGTFLGPEICSTRMAAVIDLVLHEATCCQVDGMRRPVLYCPQ